MAKKLALWTPKGFGLAITQQERDPSVILEELYEYVNVAQGRGEASKSEMGIIKKG